MLGDGDTGYHIRTGEFILDAGQVPRFDIYSFITPPLKWTAHEWLSEVVMAVIYRASGLTGIVVFFAMLLATTHWRRPSSLHYRYSDRYAYGVEPLASSSPSFFPSSPINLAPSTRSVPIQR
jgi:hypothetical protein